MGQNTSKKTVLTSCTDLPTSSGGVQKRLVPNSVSKVIIQFVNNQIGCVYIDLELTCWELKILLHQQVNQTLQPEQMTLKLYGHPLPNNSVLGNLLLLEDVIIQEKLPITELPNVECNSEGEDIFTLEKGIAKMPCGHFMGRQALIDFIKSTIAEKKQELICPHEGCSEEWDYQICRKIGCFMRSQDRQFMEGLNQNWIIKHTKKCPGCHQAAYYESEGCPKVYCHNKKCKYGPYCYLCLKKWANNNENDCGHIQCSFTRTFWTNIKTKHFTFLSGREHIQIQVPTHRLCPNCKTSIEHSQGCKHMRCTRCQTQFCFVCLSMRTKYWECGSYNDYCGKVADKQNLI